MYEKKYVGNLDIIKIIAASCIVFHHYQQTYAVKFGGGIEFYGGSIGFGYLVELFFIISGFLAAYTYKEQTRFKDYILSKLKRYYPFAFFACIACLIIALVYYTISGKQLFDLSYSIIQIITSLFLVHTGYIETGELGINNPTWYLCILTLCYIIYFFMKKIFSKNAICDTYGFAVISLCMIPLYYAVTHWDLKIPLLYHGNVRGYGSFFLGVALCIVWQRLKKKQIILLNVTLSILGIIGVCLKGFSNWYILTYFVFPAIVIFTLIIPNTKSKAIKYAGGISFEVYLWHVPLLGIFTLILDTNELILEHTYITMLLFCAVAWIWGTFIYFAIEKPLGKLLQKKIQNKKAGNEKK